MSHEIKQCPRCGVMLQIAGSHGMDHAAHFGVHQLAHRHPLAALAVVGVWAASKCVGKRIRCGECGHEFRG